MNNKYKLYFSEMNDKLTAMSPIYLILNNNVVEEFLLFKTLMFYIVNATLETISAVKYIYSVSEQSPTNALLYYLLFLSSI